MPDRICAWCGEPVVGRRRDAEFCSQRCRQAAFRLRRIRATAPGEPGTPLRFCYADPPYPGRARRYYGGEESFAGEVDFPALIASLGVPGGAYAGWALSTSMDSLRALLPLCPETARVAAWTKPIAASPLTFGSHNCWEPVIYCAGRRLRPGVRDHLSAQPARFGGELPGRKPLAFCAWLFALLGMQPGDELVDLYPGTGIVSRAWRELSFRTSTTEPLLEDRTTASVVQDVPGDGSELADAR